LFRPWEDLSYDPVIGSGQNQRKGRNLKVEPTVLIVSEHVEFAHAITTRWRAERAVPMLTMMSADLCHELDAEMFDMAILGAVRNELLPSALDALERSAKPILHICESAPLGTSRPARSETIVLRKQDGWLDVLILVATETLRRCEALESLKNIEEANRTLQSQAALGRYILEMRHSLNNALTSVLGNSELMLLEPANLPGTIRSQIETIRNMGLRMHEVLQRFSSLEKELKVGEKPLEQECVAKAHAAGARS
jgi:signal transduction histidine kinase